MTDTQFKQVMEAAFSRNAVQADILFKVLRLATAGGIMEDLLLLLKSAQVATFESGKSLLSVDKLNSPKLLDYSVKRNNDVKNALHEELFGVQDPPYITV